MRNSRKSNMFVGDYGCRPSALRLAGNLALPSAGIRLHQTENVTFRILEVSQPTDAGNRHLRNNALASIALDDLRRFIQVWHVDGVYARLSRIAPRQQSSVDPWAPAVTGRDQPVIRWSFPFRKLPPECLRIEV